MLSFPLSLFPSLPPPLSPPNLFPSFLPSSYYHAALILQRRRKHHCTLYIVHHCTDRQTILFISSASLRKEFMLKWLHFFSLIQSLKQSIDGFFNPLTLSFFFSFLNYDWQVSMAWKTEYWNWIEWVRMNQSMTFEAQNIIFNEVATFFSHSLWLTKTYKILFQLFCSLLCLPILLLSLSHLYFSIFSLNLNQRDPEFISLNVNFL